MEGGGWTLVVLEVFFNHEVVDDEVLPVGCVLAHIELEHLLDGVFLFDRHGVEADVFSDEMLELVGRDLSEAFEAGDLGVLAQTAGSSSL